ncbi:MAG: glycosyltransferase family 4 protein [Deltaproteobacteria bacterium]|nr:glycosyltransferase family 4 protein [Deltaproteobacteria bacterium]
MEVVYLPSIRSKHLDTLSYGLLATLHAIRSGVDVVDFRATPLSWYALLTRSCGIPSIVWSQGPEWDRPKWGFVARLFLKSSEISSAYLPNAMVAVSRNLQHYFERRFRRSVHFIPSGINPIHYAEPCEILTHGLSRGNYLLFLGRLDEAKGCGYLLDAYLRLKTDKRLVFAGGWQYSERYVARLRAAADHRVLFLGPVSGRLWQELFTNAYVYVQPSESEGISNSLLEAMSAGRCVVVSDIPGNVEAVGQFAITFRAGDVDHLHRQLEYVLDNPEVVAALGRRAQEHVQSHFSWDRSTDRLLSLYESLATPRR